MSVVSLSSGGQTFMTSGTLTSPNSLIVMGARSWRELEIYLSKPWTGALPSLPRVCSFVRIALTTCILYIPHSISPFFFFYTVPSFTAIYLLYAKLEEGYGLARHAMAVYERATQAVESEERHHMFNIYIKRAAEIYGVTYTRAIYQKAIEVLVVALTLYFVWGNLQTIALLNHYLQYSVIVLQLHALHPRIGDVAICNFIDSHMSWVNNNDSSIPSCFQIIICGL